MAVLRVGGNLPGANKVSTAGSPAVVCTDTTDKNGWAGALINCQEFVFHVALVDNIGRKISQEFKSLRRISALPASYANTSTFCCCFRRKQEAWSLQQKKINHIFFNFPVEFVCYAPTMYFAQSVKFSHQILTEENMKRISCKNNWRIWSGNLSINLFLGTAKLPVSKSWSGEETEGLEGSASNSSNSSLKISKSTQFGKVLSCPLKQI